MDLKQEKAERKSVQLALDAVEMGQDPLEEGQEEENRVKKRGRQKLTLPSGITHRMLFGDVVRIALPAFVEMVLAQLVSMADMMMVGQISPQAISAVGICTQPIMLLQMVFIALNVGTTALISRYKGEGDMHRANSVMRHALLITAALSVLFSVVGYIFAGQMIAFMGATDTETFVAGTQYMQIRMIGFLPMTLTTVVTASLRGVGDSRTAMIYNLTANVVNVIFNYLLIYGNFGFPRLEVAGAAIATVIGIVVAFIMAFVVLLRGKRYLWLNLKEKFTFDRVILSNIFLIGIPSMFEQLVLRIGLISYTRIAVSLGTIAYATHQVCLNIAGLSFMPGQAITAATTTLTGQYLGKKRTDMALGYNRCAQASAVIIGFICCAVFFFLGEQITRLYSNDAQVVVLGGQVMRLIALYQPLQALQFAMSGALQGAGDTKATAAIMCLTVMIIRPVFAHVAINTFNLGLMGAWYAMAADWVVRSMLILLRYLSGKWKRIKLKS